jgi:hypothetical protein
MPMLVYSTSQNPSSFRANVLKCIVSFKRCGVAPVALSDDAGTSRSIVSITSSAAARCAVDALCLVFSYLPVQDFISVQQVCQTWRAVRLRPASWPNGGDAAVHGEMTRDPSSAVQLYALRSLQSELISSDTSSNGIAVLVSLLDSAMAEQAFGVLVTMVDRNTHCIDKILRANVLPALCKLSIRIGTNTHLLRVVSTLQSRQHQQVIERSCPGLFGDDEDIQLQAAEDIRRLICGEEIKERVHLVACNVSIMDKLVSLLRTSRSEKLRSECAWILTNIASGTTEQAQTVVKAGAIPVLIELLKTSSSSETKEHVMWALSNIAGDSVQSRDLVLATDVWQLMQNIDIQNAPVAQQWIYTLLIVNLCRNKPTPNFTLMCAALPLLSRIFHASDDEKVVFEACHALCFISADNKATQSIIDHKLVPCVLHVLAQPYQIKSTVCALRTITNLASGQDVHTQAVVDCGVLLHLRALLTNSNLRVREETIFAISNITAGNEIQIDAVLAAGIIPMLVSVLSSSSASWREKKEATWAITNVTTRGSIKQIRYLVDQQAIPRLCRMFACSDSALVLQAMEGINNILLMGRAAVDDNTCRYTDIVEQCGGRRLLDALLRHDVPDIHKKAQQILTTYFASIKMDES